MTEAASPGTSESESRPASAANVQTVSDPRAQELCREGLRFMQGDGVEPDLAKAVERLRAASELEHPDACFTLALLHTTGRGVPKDDKEAARLYDVAARHGHSDALHNLAVHYYSGLGGLPIDHAKFRELMARAADLGHERARKVIEAVAADKQPVAKTQVDVVCRGYSRMVHWEFFEHVMRSPGIRSVCVLGVYFGRDVCYLGTLARLLGRDDVRITGVDKFEDAFCDDWPEEKRQMNWEQAGFGPAPSLAAARTNVERLGLGGCVTLVRQRDEEFLLQEAEKFDLIYIDTAHDYESVLKLIRLARGRLNPGGYLAGDDYSNEGTWGVEKAVRTAFAKLRLLGGWIWIARGDDCRI